MLTIKKLKEFKEYLESGAFIEDLEARPPDGQAEMLDMIELLFEICELADEKLTEHFYRRLRGEV
ncbi:hypothetical protein [Thermodesulfatator atlanticus]|uniref:hypothetical protein n=1 Tax=Thermodesulfatator atlanticus TaxID=501497 RepID=UPI0003B3BDE9|nr:hypothetical protein [Thermodesulfatator atlanticus]